VDTEEGIQHFSEDMSVSMNMWALTTDVLDRLEQQFIDFLANGGLNHPTSEFLIPVEIGAMLKTGAAVQVRPVSNHWLGVTFAEDVPGVQDALAQMHRSGLYPTPLF
jgi:hypothetical protein